MPKIVKKESSAQPDSPSANASTDSGIIATPDTPSEVKLAASPTNVVAEEQLVLPNPDVAARRRIVSSAQPEVFAPVPELLEEVVPPPYVPIREAASELFAANRVRDSRMVIDGIPKDDQVLLVERIVELGLLHPATDRVPREIAGFVRQLLEEMNPQTLGDANPQMILGSHSAIKRRGTILTGEVKNLIVYSTDAEPDSLPVESTTVALAKSLASAGIEVFKSADWSKVFVRYRDAYSGQNYGLLTCEKFNPDLDHQHFYAHNHPTNSRRFSTVSLAEHGKIEAIGRQLMFSPSFKTDSWVDSVLTPVTKNDPNPFEERGVKLKRLVGRFL